MCLQTSEFQRERARRRRGKISAKNKDKVLLGELYSDHVYLSKLLENPKLKGDMGKTEKDTAIRQSVSILDFSKRHWLKWNVYFSVRSRHR